MLPFHRSLLVAAAAAAVLVPWTARDVDRNAALDIELVRSGQVEYKGIEASFEELSRAHALTAFSEAEFLGWSAVPNPVHPEAEALVTCRFRVAAAAPGSAPGTGQGRIPLDVTWRLNTLAGVEIAAHDEGARGAVATFRATVDDFLDRLVLVGAEDAFLRRGPGPGHAVVDTLDAGTALLREETGAEWTRVRPAGPGTGTFHEGGGWLRSDRLVPLRDTD